MTAQALYRRWRSQTFAEIIGQEHVTHTLLNALRAGRISHAYLFAGPRGTGKTTTARVLAKAVNCLNPQDGEPCNRCSICQSLNEGRSLDLIEMDGASNRGIDEIRDVREKIVFAPSECRYKVYVIDEVHMLTDPAFNALLKTLEEPPPHAIFILATTEPHKVPLTVLSRCQRFDFRRVSLSHLKQKLELICAREGIRIQPAALDAIARHASGSFRDAESLLDQLASYEAEITLEDVRQVLGAAPQEIITGMIQALVARDVSAGLRLINEAVDSGVEPRQLTREVLEYLRGLLLVKNGSASLLQVTDAMRQEMTALAEAMPLERLLQTAKLFNQAANYLKTSLHGQLPLELAFVEAASLDERATASGEKGAPMLREQPARSPAPKPATEEKESIAVAESIAQSTVAPISSAVTESAEEAVEPPPAPSAEETTASGITLAWLQENWGRLLQATKPRNRMVEALLKSCEPICVEEDLVTLGFYHSFHKERVAEDKHRVVVEEALAELTGRFYRVKCVLYEGDRKGREQQNEVERREKLLENPVVSEAIKRYGARVVDIQ
nr:DNA polymerase III subunit gamma/tau [Chloroflexota bacterium]